MTPLHRAALAAAVDPFLIWCMAIGVLYRRGRVKLTDPHHEYYGIPLLCAPAAWGAWAVTLWVLGLWWMFDDAWQHVIQAAFNPVYQSPWHRWYVDAVAWFKKVTAR